jgi:hypothetical protein
MTSGARTLIAFEIRMQRIGFVILREPEILLEWGVWHYRGSAEYDRWLTAKLDACLGLHTPCLVVIRKRRWRRPPHPISIVAMRTIRNITYRRAISMHSIPAWHVTKFFRKRGYRNKHRIGEVLVARFGELQSKLPRPRKIGEPERHNVVIFDALATAVAALAVIRASQGDHRTRLDAAKTWNVSTENSTGLWPGV